MGQLLGPRLSSGFGYPILYIEVHVVTALSTSRGIVTKTPLTSLNCYYFTFAIPVMHIVIGSHAVLLLSSADLAYLIFYFIFVAANHSKGVANFSMNGNL